MLLTTTVMYRGFERKADHVLGYNIIVVPNRRYGLNRRSGIFGSILDMTSVRYSDPGGENTVPLPPIIQF